VWEDEEPERWWWWGHVMEDVVGGDGKTVVVIVANDEAGLAYGMVLSYRNEKMAGWLIYLDARRF
jgi:hypothetical protein